jgi:hypothetical protein
MGSYPSCQLDLRAGLDTLLEMGMGGPVFFVGFAIKLLIAGSHVFDGAGFQFSASGSKKTNSYHLICA